MLIRRCEFETCDKVVSAVAVRQKWDVRDKRGQAIPGCARAC